MSEVERQLLALGRGLDWPAEPDLAPRVGARVAERPAGVLLSRRRALVLGLAVLVVAIAAAFAVPSARTAILRWLGLEHVRVSRVAELPPTRRVAGTDLGVKTTLEAVRREVRFKLLLPRERPDSVYVQYAFGAKRVTLVYGSAARPRLLLSEFRGSGTSTYIEKLAGPETKVEHVRVNGEPGIWLSGAPHAVYYTLPGKPENVYPDEAFLAGNTLVWERDGGLTLRLEGKLTKGDAVRLAKSLH